MIAGSVLDLQLRSRQIVGDHSWHSNRDNAFFSWESVDWGQIQINWEQVCARIQVTWGKLNEHDLAAIAGDREVFSSLLQERYRYRKAQADKKIEQFAEGLVLNHRGTNAAVPGQGNETTGNSDGVLAGANGCHQISHDSGASSQ